MTTQTITTSGAGTFTVPANTNSLTIEAWGAGGGGGGSTSPAACGGGGGGYSLAIVTVSPGQTVFYNVGAGGAGNLANGSPGGTSWVNPSANSQPASNGVVAAGGTGGDVNFPSNAAGGAGSIGTTNFTGGTGVNGQAHVGGSGGGGAGSAGNGGDGVSAVDPGPSAGGTAGSPDGGTGGTGVQNGPSNNAMQPGGGGGGSWNSGTGSNGADGQVRFTWFAPFGPGVTTTLTKGVPAKAFTRNHFDNLLDQIREEGITSREAIEGLSEIEIADRDFESAEKEAELADRLLSGQLSQSAYNKAKDAQEKLDRARKERDHQYYMKIIQKAWDDFNEAKKR